MSMALNFNFKSLVVDYPSRASKIAMPPKCVGKQGLGAFVGVETNFELPALHYYTALLGLKSKQALHLCIPILVMASSQTKT